MPNYYDDYIADQIFCSAEEWESYCQDMIEMNEAAMRGIERDQSSI